MSSPGPVWADVHAALLAGLAGLAAFSSVSVFDGEPITNDAPPDRVSVGFVTDDGAGAFQQAPDPSGFGTIEAGEIRCMIASNAGDADPAVTRDRVFALFVAWQQWLWNNPTMDGRVPACQVVNLSAQVDAVQNVNGSGAGLLVTVAYQATVFVS